MGYMRDHAILVSSFSGELVGRARSEAVRCGLGDLCTPVIRGRHNAHESFAVMPDGSKEGWQPSDVADRERNRFIEWLRAQAHDDGSTSLRWALVQFGDDEGEALVVEHDQDRDTPTGETSVPEPHP